MVGGKNLRDNTVTGVTPLPDIDEQVDPSCDGVDSIVTISMNGVPN